MKKYLFAVIFISCASINTSGETIANETREPPPPIEISVKESKPEISVGHYLQYALMSFKMKNFDKAKELFELAINSGELNDAGRAVSYWHISQCWFNLNNQDEAIESLYSFIFISQEIVDFIKDDFGMKDEVEFANEFDLFYKLEWARVLLSYAWVNRSDIYGRSLDYPILFHTESELELFAEITRDSCYNPENFSRVILSENPRIEKLKSERNTELFVVVGNDRSNNNSK